MRKDWEMIIDINQSPEKKPNYKTKQVAMFDVDETLIKDRPGEKQSVKDFVMLDYYGMERKRWIHRRHVELVIAHKKRGYQVIVHSANGKPWADEVVDKLGLREYVDRTDTKPCVCFDDKPAEEWMPRVWVEDV